MKLALKPILWGLLVFQAAPVIAALVADGVVPAAMRETIGWFAGDYHGNWNTELTESDVDDISRYDLSDSVLRLSLDADYRLAVAFFIDPGAADQNQPLDLLGFGCNSKVGQLRELSQRKAQDGTIVTDAVFDFDWGRCPSRVHAVPGTRLTMELVRDVAEETLAIRLRLLRKVQGDYQVYAKINGERRPVEVRPTDGGTLYNPELEYCVEDEYGEQVCSTGQSEVKVIGGPVPFPGATVLWWTKKTPALKVEKGTKFLFHEAVYTRSSSADS